MFIVDIAIEPSLHPMTAHGKRRFSKEDDELHPDIGSCYVPCGSNCKRRKPDATNVVDSCRCERRLGS
jgi:hypothetical protein